MDGDMEQTRRARPGRDRDATQRAVPWHGKAVTVSALLGVFGVACLAGVSITGALLDRFPQTVLTTAVATQAVGMLGLYAAGTDPTASVVFLVLMGAALRPVFTTTQNVMLHCAPGRTDMALVANSGSYNAGIAAGAALGGGVLAFADVRATFLAGGLLAVAACLVLVAVRPRYGP